MTVLFGAKVVCNNKGCSNEEFIPMAVDRSTGKLDTKDYKIPALWHVVDGQVYCPSCVTIRTIRKEL